MWVPLERIRFLRRDRFSVGQRPVFYVVHKKGFDLIVQGDGDTPVQGEPAVDRIHGAVTSLRE